MLLMGLCTVRRPRNQQCNKDHTHTHSVVWIQVWPLVNVEWGNLGKYGAPGSVHVLSAKSQETLQEFKLFFFFKPNKRYHTLLIHLITELKCKRFEYRLDCHTESVQGQDTSPTFSLLPMNSCVKESGTMDANHPMIPTQQGIFIYLFFILFMVLLTFIVSFQLSPDPTKPYILHVLWRTYKLHTDRHSLVQQYSTGSFFQPEG